MTARNWIAEGRSVGVQPDGTIHYYAVAERPNGTLTLMYVTNFKQRTVNREWLSTTYAPGRKGAKAAVDHLNVLNFPPSA